MDYIEAIDLIEYSINIIEDASYIIMHCHIISCRLYPYNSRKHNCISCGRIPRRKLEEVSFNNIGIRRMTNE